MRKPSTRSAPSRLPANRRVASLLLPGLLAALIPAAGQDGASPAPENGPSPVLASYDFEETVPSGPDTYWLREREGSVDLSRAFKVSGERSLHLREVPGDRDFSEFLVYFDERREGAVFVQFYLLVTDPGQTLNVGLAGSRWFLSREQHGQAVWLRIGDGELSHRGPGEFQKLFAPRPFVWYFFDLVYDVDRGLYDLAVYEEGSEKPVVDLRRQRNFADQDESSVRYFSLIGDLEDTDGVSFFVDDLLVATDPAVLQKPFVAPGRRRYFVELFAAARPKLDAASREDLLWEARRLLQDPDFAAGAGERKGRTVPDRLEEAGDVAFTAGELDLAREIYERLAREPGLSVRMWLKLADVAHLTGDAERERELRESIYGRLDLEEER